MITTVVRKGAGIMAPFRKTEISDVELQALALYLARPRCAAGHRTIEIT